jgi:hypothetical protein
MSAENANELIVLANTTSAAIAPASMTGSVMLIVLNAHHDRARTLRS